MLSAAIDVALGLIFTYLLLALFASAVQEWWADRLKLRSRQLYDGIWRMLTTGAPNPARVSPRSLTSTSASGGVLQLASAADLFKLVWGHDLIKSLSQDGHGPSYIPSRVFSLALLDVLRNGSAGAEFACIEQSIDKLPNGAAKQALTTLLVDAGGDLDRLKTAIATWFDDAMDRASGAYKRYTQTFTFLFGLAAAILLNVSTTELASTLWRDPVARQAVAAQAEVAARRAQPLANAPNITSDATQAAAQLGALPLPIGWGQHPLTILYGPSASNYWPGSWPELTHLLTVVLGWVMTALAVGLGAPFWFDTLQRFVNLRAAGPAPSPAKPRSDR